VLVRHGLCAATGREVGQRWTRIAGATPANEGARLANQFTLGPLRQCTMPARTLSIRVSALCGHGGLR